MKNHFYETDCVGVSVDHSTRMHTVLDMQIPLKLNYLTSIIIVSVWAPMFGIAMGVTVLLY